MNWVTKSMAGRLKLIRNLPKVRTVSRTVWRLIGRRITKIILSILRILRCLNTSIRCSKMHITRLVTVTNLSVWEVEFRIRRCMKLCENCRWRRVKMDLTMDILMAFWLQKLRKVIVRNATKFNTFCTRFLSFCTRFLSFCTRFYEKKLKVCCVLHYDFSEFARGFTPLHEVCTRFCTRSNMRKSTYLRGFSLLHELHEVKIKLIG